MFVHYLGTYRVEKRTN